MAQFVELEDGQIINLDHVISMWPRLNRIDFITGSHVQLSEADGEKIRTLMRESSKPPQMYMPWDEHTAHALPGRNPNAETLDLNQKPKKRRGRPPKAT